MPPPLNRGVAFVAAFAVAAAAAPQRALAGALGALGSFEHVEATGSRPVTDTSQRRAELDSTLAVATFDSAWGTVGASLRHRGVTRIDWTAVGRELRPRAARARSDSALRAVIGDMLRRVGESHFAVLPGQEAAIATGASNARAGAQTLGTAGVTVRLVDGELLVWRVDSGGAARKAGVRPGAVVVRIDQFDAPSLGPADSVGVRRVAAVTGAARALNGVAGSVVRLTLRDADGTRRDVAFPRDSVRGPVSRFGNLPPLPASFEMRRMTLDDGRCVGVLQFDYWLPPVIPMLDRAIDEVRGCAGIVLDLRGNLGGVAAMMMGVAGHFMKEPLLLGTMRTRGDEMKFVANPRRSTEAGMSVEPFAGPLAIVVDGMSASTSEMFAAALQGLGRARLFGERTAGQALPAIATRLPNGDVLMHVVADFVAPNGSRIEGQGVAPDEHVPLVAADARAGRDAPLEAAVGWIERTRRGAQQ